MWSKPIQDGGVVGGSRVGIDGNTFYMGGSYNVRFASGIVMYGRLFYQEPYGNSGGGGDYVAVDLRTGEELWRTNVTATGAPNVWLPI
jgi:outer membrane protein assembly factor BamB